jgi:hypothetical protein
LILSRTSDNGGTAGGNAFKYNLYADEGEAGTPFHLIEDYDGASMSYTVNAGDDIGSTSGLTFTAGKIYTFKMTA